MILLRYIDNFVVALATERILIALRGVALIFYDGAGFTAPSPVSLPWAARFCCRDIDGLDGARI